MSEHILHISDLPVPVKIYVERRNNSRVAMASEHVIIRLPAHLPAEEKNKRVRDHIEWARKQLGKKDHYAHKRKGPADYHGRTIRLYDTDFHIDVTRLASGRNRLSYRNDLVLRIFLLETLDDKTTVSEIQRLLIRFAEKYFTGHIKQRTEYFNTEYFREQTGRVRLNHTVSKWGSCSPKRDIMFSTKLLLLPQPVIDYVIVHELAHLKEMNHSPRFWAEVERSMPDYKKWDRWLTRHGGEFHF